jgi:S-adenosyl-L-methionine hydrolase (adenosine-forming)
VSAARIFLATDYGLDDEFVGVLHAVIASLAPHVQVVDLSHGIAPFDVAGGAALLARAAPHLGAGVVCAVVDPGVGTARSGVIIEVASTTGPRHLVGPDNGLLPAAATVLGGPARVVALTPAQARAPGSGITFDGRDLFAPAAARLAMGADPDSLGTRIETPSLIELAAPTPTVRDLDDGRIALVTTVRWIDRFGNVQLALPGSVLAGAATAGVVVRDEDALVRVVATFGELDRGTAGLLRDANDCVALVVAQGSAASRFRVAVGDRVELVGSFGPLF